MSDRRTHQPPQQRKHLLIQQGAAYRAAVSESMQTVQDNLHPDALTRNALDYAGRHVWPGVFAMAGQALRKEGTLAALLPVLIPLAKGGWSRLQRRPLRKTLLHALALALPVATLAYLASRKAAARTGDADADAGAG